MSSWLSYQIIKNLIKKRKIDKIQEIFLKEKEAYFFKKRNFTNLIELCFKSDLCEQNAELMKIFITLIQKGIVNINRFFNEKLESGNTLKEEIFISQEAFPILKTFLEHGFVSFEEKYELIEKDNIVEEQKYNGIYFFLSLINNNIPAIQLAYLYFPQIFNYRDENGNTFLPYAIFNSNETILNMVLENSNPNLKNEDGRDQIENCFYFLKDEFYENYNKDIYDISDDHFNNVIKNLLKTITYFKYDILNPYYNKNNVVVDAILERNLQFVDLCFNRFFINLASTRYGYSLIDVIAKTYNFEGIKKFKNFEQKYNHNYLFINNDQKHKTYINFLNAPLFLCEEEDFQEKIYCHFFNQCINEFDLDIHETNKYGNSYLHMICYHLKENFEKYFYVFKFFIEKYKLSPLVRNNFSQTPIDLIEQENHRNIVIKYLETQGYYFKSQKEIELEKLRNTEIKLKDLNIILTEEKLNTKFNHNFTDLEEKNNEMLYFLNNMKTNQNIVIDYN